ncbi:cytochrome P450 [Amycolatopsis rhabdoformis]|uniref:Cytochrome P450 n=1 Tax=Amycolatopsis rhabdoformis TaxID=1448059 RepID=A0ABZ1IA01_9PSEU|nr:cytochrome P450 [Amycolatopsis rhabdoformis]WSE31305.1 cytochrome P450 [Amycolatopsis rhabdoformis]
MTSATPTVPELDDDPFDHAVLADPYEYHRRLREAGPVVWLPAHGYYVIGRFAEVRAALLDWETFVSGRGAGLTDFAHEEPWRPPSLLLEADPPDHTVVRTAMNSVITPRAVRALRKTFEPVAERLADELVARGRFDAVTDVAEVYPLEVFPDAVGLPREGREHLLTYGSLALNAFGPRNDLLAAALAAAGPAQEWVDTHCRREELAPTGLGVELWAAADRGEISEQQAPLLVRSLLTAGVDTTVTGLGNTLYALARHPEAWARLHADPRLAKFAFDEALRWESPIQNFFRTTSADTEVGGVPVPAGAKVQLSLGSANRDPRHWGADAEVFDLDRSASGHVGFGMGVHQCVGQPIARLEAELVLTALARRVARLELDGTPVPKLNNTLKVWSSVPIAVEAA